MANLTPIRDAAGDIIDLVPAGQSTGFAALLAETMAATGAAPAAVERPQEEETQRPRTFGRREIAGIVCGLVVALALIALINWAMPAQEAPRAPALPTAAAPGVVGSQPTPAPTASPTAAQVMVVGFAAPDGVVLGPVPLPAAATARYGDDWLGFPWAGGVVWVRRSDWPTAPLAGLPDLTPPTPAPIVVWEPPAQAAGQAAPATPAHEMPSNRSGPPTATPPPLLSGERLSEYFLRTGITPQAVTP